MTPQLYAPAIPADAVVGACRCVYCGLPVAAASSVAVTEEVLYCCYGCRFAHAVVRESQARGEIRWTIVRLGLSIFFTMNLMTFTMTMWSLDVYDVEPDPFQVTLFEVFRWLSMVFALPVLLLLGLPILQNGYDCMRARRPSTDFLVGVAVLAAYLTSVANVIRASGGVYFEVGASVLVMMTLGRWIEATGKQKARETLDSLLALLPENVTRCESDPISSAPAECVVSADSIQVGDLLRIRAGERFPTDAVVYLGSTTVDEQVFSGESTPESRSPGDNVLAGTVNLDGDVVVRTTARLREGSFGRLLSLIQEARNARGYYQQAADRVAVLFFPIVSAVAAMAFFWHLSSGVGTSIQVCMSVLLIACPCALGLATPLAVWTALSTAVRHQVLFRSGEAIERLAGISNICFDKTGTLTTGTPQVGQSASFTLENQSQSFNLCHQLSAASAHPFSKAVHNYTSAMQNSDNRFAEEFNALSDVRTVPGGGIQALLKDGTEVRLGSPEFSCCDFHRPVKATEMAIPDLCVGCRESLPLGLRVQMDRFRMSADHNSASIVLLSVGRVPKMGFLISETIRPDAALALHQLQEQNCSLYILSGDRPAKGRFLLKQLAVATGADPRHRVPQLTIECGLTPDAKVQHVRRIKATSGNVAMVGDGINDAPALAASDVGIAMGCGADVSRDSAQICLLSNNLTRIPWAIRLARRTRRVIRQNLFWAFAYNTIGIILAACGMLNPAIAAGLMIVSSLLVISNSLGLLRDASPENILPKIDLSSHEARQSDTGVASTMLAVPHVRPQDLNSFVAKVRGPM